MRKCNEKRYQKKKKKKERKKRKQELFRSVQEKKPQRDHNLGQRIGMND